MQHIDDIYHHLYRQGIRFTYIRRASLETSERMHIYGTFFTEIFNNATIDDCHVIYIRGSTTAAPFRSPAEFFFHAKWILEGCPKPDVPSQFDEGLWGKPLPEDFIDQCGCTYCAKTPQDYISRTYSNYIPAKKKTIVKKH